MLAISIIVSVLMTLIGLHGIERVHSYENIWGLAFWVGAIMTMILAVISIGYFLLAML